MINFIKSFFQDHSKDNAAYFIRQDYKDLDFAILSRRKAFVKEDTEIKKMEIEREKLELNYSHILFGS